MKNKRKTKRFDCSVPVDGQSGGLFDQVKTLDFSKGGLGFFSPHEIPLNKEITVELDLADDSEPVFVIGKVQWTAPMEDSSGYRIGMTFKDVLSGSKSRLTKYFSNKSETENAV